MKKWSYYNDNDPYILEWVRNLIKAGLVPDGEVDGRSITEVESDDLKGFTQCHFFCGILGWPHALDIAGWGDRPVWTGSCPCQPLSSAGRRKGHVDKRHLWPTFHDLIAECQPAMVFGEQVASKDGREWFCAVRADLERLGYACGGADMSAAGVGAPHVRQRLWWVADATGVGKFIKREKRELVRGNDSNGHCGEWRGNGRVNKSAWSDAEFILCDDGKTRPVEPGIAPLAHGVPKRVGKLRAYGNAIVSPLAAEFVAAFMECQDDQLA